MTNPYEALITVLAAEALVHRANVDNAHEVGESAVRVDDAEVRADIEACLRDDDSAHDAMVQAARETIERAIRDVEDVKVAADMLDAAAGLLRIAGRL